MPIPASRMVKLGHLSFVDNRYIQLPLHIASSPPSLFFSFAVTSHLIQYHFHKELSHTLNSILYSNLSKHNAASRQPARYLPQVQLCHCRQHQDLRQLWRCKFYTLSDSYFSRFCVFYLTSIIHVLSCFPHCHVVLFAFIEHKERGTRSPRCFIVRLLLSLMLHCSHLYFVESAVGISKEQDGTGEHMNFPQTRLTRHVSSQTCPN